MAGYQSQLLSEEITPPYARDLVRSSEVRMVFPVMSLHPPDDSSASFKTKTLLFMIVAPPLPPLLDINGNPV